MSGVVTQRHLLRFSSSVSLSVQKTLKLSRCTEIEDSFLNIASDVNKQSVHNYVLKISRCTVYVVSLDHSAQANDILFQSLKVAVSLCHVQGPFEKPR